MSWKNMSGIAWDMTTPPSNAYVWDADAESTEKSMEKNVPIKRGDEIVVLYVEKEPYLITEWHKKGGTVKEVLEHLYEALDYPLKPSTETVGGIYQRISQWFNGEKRIELIKKYENGQLKPKELLGDHCFFEGMGRSGNSKNIWVSTGS